MDLLFTCLESRQNHQTYTSPTTERGTDGIRKRCSDRPSETGVPLTAYSTKFFSNTGIDVGLSSILSKGEKNECGVPLRHEASVAGRNAHFPTASTIAETSTAGSFSTATTCTDVPDCFRVQRIALTEVFHSRHVGESSGSIRRGRGLFHPDTTLPI